MSDKSAIRDVQPPANVDDSSDAQKRRTTAVYSKLAPLYCMFRVKDGLDTVLELMEIEPGQRILDAGTGPGVYALHIAQNWPSCEVHGFDLCKPFLDTARERALKQNTGNAHFAVGDAERVHYPDETFDRILFAGTLVLLPDKARAVSEAYRALKPGGIAVFKELLHKWFLHKEVFYVLWRLYVKAAGVFVKDLRGIRRRDYEGRKFTESSMSGLLEESPFTDYRVFIKGTRLYAVCRK
jgi:ubiquinone/menaquinone biosynthesis C-methylase UbiE